MSAKYTAESLADIAALFEQMAEDCARQADKQTAVGRRNLLNRESRTWTRAAQIVSNTTLSKAEARS